MPRHSKGPHLWKRPARRKDGKIIASAVWIIKDSGKHIATGCVASATERNPPPEAEQALSAYIASKYGSVRRHRDVNDIPIPDVLARYLKDKIGDHPNPSKLTLSIGRLNDFFGNDMLGDITEARCKEYAEHRGGRGGARRDLEDFRAAINHHAKQRLHTGIIHVTLPPKGIPRERWLTRSEVAKLLWTCWRYRETQTVHRGKRRGQIIETEKRPLRHLCRFILIGAYTGTRHGAILSASPFQGEGHSFVDLDRGVFFRLAEGRRQTNKRQPPAPVPTRLLAHMRRWKDKNLMATHFVEWNGRPCKQVDKAFAHAVELAGLEGDVIPHTLRHTAATWLMQRGVPIWQAAGFLGMSEKTLRDTYGHHHPDHMLWAAEAITSKDQVVKKVVSLNEARGKFRKTV